jgi:hypothetical protein
VNRAAAIKDGYTKGARARRAVDGQLARTRVTPNALTAAGVLLCAVASIVVLFEHRNERLFYWLGAAPSSSARCSTSSTAHSPVQAESRRPSERS